MNAHVHHFYLLGGDETAAREFLDEKFGEGSESPAEALFHEVYETFGVEEAESFRGRAYLEGSTDAPRVFAIHAQSFTHEALQSLLKVLEEPPKGVVIALTEWSASVIPDTIRSRAHRVQLSSNNSDFDAKGFLKLPIPKRLALVSKIIESHKDDETSAPLRYHAQNVLSAILKEAVKVGSASAARGETLSELTNMLSHLSFRGANVKMILEHTSFTL